jgi:uncharacterized protein (TIGR02270 family)
VTLDDLARLDARLAAHLAGLHLAGAEGRAICAQVFVDQGAGEVFTLAVLALREDDPRAFRGVLEARADDPGRIRGASSALGWLPYVRVAGAIASLLASGSPELRRIGIAGAALHRQDPGRPLRDALGDGDPSLRARALRAAGELNLVALQDLVRESLAAGDDGCRFWAAWSSALLTSDNPEAVALLQAIAEEPGPYQARALPMAARRMDPLAGVLWRKTLAEDRGQPRLAVLAAGALGAPEGVPWLIDQMRVPALARVAAEAFATITGVDLAAEHLDGPRPAGFAAGPTEDPEDEDVALDPDERLAWPCMQDVQRWWDAHQERFSKGTRYLAGQPLRPPWLQGVLRTGLQRLRSAAALELAMQQPGQSLFEVRAPGFRQIKTLTVAKEDRSRSDHPDLH